MDINKYSDTVFPLIAVLNTRELDLAHMALGLSGESGEVVDIIKKHIAYGKPLDTEHLREEMGDTLFYLNALIRLSGLTWDEVTDTNVRKLSVRYPGLQFDASRAVNRDAEAESEATRL